MGWCAVADSGGPRLRTHGFDLLAIVGEDLPDWPLVERKGWVRRLIPSVPTRLLYVCHIKARGRDFFRVACAHDLEGVMAKPGSQVLQFPRRPTHALRH